ncbi:hypothetical protein AS159_09370 [Thermotoga sp. Ku-13t]|nr:hypothetical protein AS159_09370 [Thermotoga sp. Ku-13t]
MQRFNIHKINETVRANGENRICELNKMNMVERRAVEQFERGERKKIEVGKRKSLPAHAGFFVFELHAAQ